MRLPAQPPAREASPEPLPHAEPGEKTVFDLSLVEMSLGYEYSKRAEQHQAALDLALELEKIGKQLRDQPQSTTPPPVGV